LNIRLIDKIISETKLLWRLWPRLDWAYAKQLMQINKLLFIIHELVKVVYKKKKLMKIKNLLVKTYELI